MVFLSPSEWVLRASLTGLFLVLVAAAAAPAQGLAADTTVTVTQTVTVPTTVPTTLTVPTTVSVATTLTLPATTMTLNFQTTISLPAGTTTVTEGSTTVTATSVTTETIMAGGDAAQEQEAGAGPPAGLIPDKTDEAKAADASKVGPPPQGPESLIAVGAIAAVAGGLLVFLHMRRNRAAQMVVPQAIGYADETLAVPVPVLAMPIEDAFMGPPRPVSATVLQAPPVTASPSPSARHAGAAQIPRLPSPKAAPNGPVRREPTQRAKRRDP